MCRATTSKSCNDTKKRLTSFSKNVSDSKIKVTETFFDLKSAKELTGAKGIVTVKMTEVN